MTKRNTAFTVGVSLTLLGFIVMVVGLTRALSGRTGMDYQGMAIFGAFLASVSGGLVLYSVFAADVSLWVIHNGGASPTRIPVALMSFGLSLMVFALLYLGILAWTDGLGTSQIKAGLVIESVSGVLLVSGALGRGRAMFRPNEEWQFPEGKRKIIGTSFILLGLAIDLCLTSYGLTYGYVGPIPFYLGLMTGVAVIIGGMTILAGPFPRPWIPGRQDVT